MLYPLWKKQTARKNLEIKTEKHVLVPEFTKFLWPFRFRRFKKICTINQREPQDWIWFIVLRKWCRSSSTQDRKRERGKRWLKRNGKKELARVESKSPYNHGWIAEWTSWAHRERGSPEPMPVFEVRICIFISSIILKLLDKREATSVPTVPQIINDHCHAAPCVIM